MGKTNTLIPTTEELKKDFKIECSKNGTNMTDVTIALWRSYIKRSREIRQKKVDLLNKMK